VKSGIRTFAPCKESNCSLSKSMASMKNHNQLLSNNNKDINSMSHASRM
jgi:hypothetical protein